MPSLKNSRNLGWVDRKNGKKRPILLKSDEVTNWLEGIKASLLYQFIQQGSPKVGKDVPIVVWTEIVVQSKKIVPNKDGDNVWTTLQETLQIEEKKGILGFVRDDKQVVAHSVWVRTVNRLIQEHATVYAWVMEDPYFYPMELTKFMLGYYIPKILEGGEYTKTFKGAADISDLWEQIQNML